MNQDNMGLITEDEIKDISMSSVINSNDKEEVQSLTAGAAAGGAAGAGGGGAAGAAAK